MLCPHCKTGFRWQPERRYLDQNDSERWSLEYSWCTECEGFIVELIKALPNERFPYAEDEHSELERFRIWPRTSGRDKAPQHVPSDIADDYNEACLVLDVSPRSAAALARRCLQTVIREGYGIRRRDLDSEIQELVQSGTLPSLVADQLDAVRWVGNFAAHPIKSQRTGEALPVEPGEAEWVLDTLSSLLDLKYVQPVKDAQRRASLNEKLREAGKPELKTGQQQPPT